MRAAAGSTIRNPGGLPRPNIRWSGILVAVWTCLLVSVPIVRWTLGDAALPAIVTATVVVLASAMCALLVETLGLRTAATTAAKVLVCAWLIEFAGSQSGFPFGRYHYTDALQPQIGGVPVVIPLAWLMMLPPAWAIGAGICGRSRGVAFIGASSLAFAAWDLYLDPQMVRWGIWEWEQPGGYFGIPWQNFGGWIAAAALITWLTGRIELSARLPLAVYALTWILQAIGMGIFWRMPGPALCGFAAMGGALMYVYAKLRLWLN